MPGGSTSKSCCSICELVASISVSLDKSASLMPPLACIHSRMPYVLTSKSTKVKCVRPSETGIPVIAFKKVSLSCTNDVSV